MSNERKTKTLRALVIDDELDARCVIATGLMKEEFVCDVAESVEEALDCIVHNHFHLVVTDLAMPNRNGHSLAIELLTMPERPVIVVLTGVMEPRIAKDLISRGVDDVIFKPIQMKLFAAKVRALTDRCLRHARLMQSLWSLPVSSHHAPS